MIKGDIFYPLFFISKKGKGQITKEKMTIIFFKLVVNEEVLQKD